MSPEDENDVKGETPPEPGAAKKRRIAKRIGKRDSAKKDSAPPQAAEQEGAAQEGGAKGPASKEPAAKEPVAQEPAPKEPVAKASAAKEPARKEPAPAKTPAASKRASGDAPAPKEPAARPARRSGATAGPAPRRRVVRARARYVRTSARKARMVCGHLRGKSVQEARAILAFTPRDVARDWSKLLESAVANAESNHELLEDDLIVREAYADEGPTIKRFRPRAMGRATPIRKRTSHLTITLTPGP
jgi:ribosomal protein L22